MDAVIGYGADADELERIAALLGHAAGVLDARRSTLNAHVHHAPWHGHEADRFRQSWDHQYSRSLVNAAAYLHSARATLTKNAAEQRAASSAAEPAGFTGGSSRRAAPAGGSSRLDELLHGLSVGQDAWTIASGPVGILSLVTTGRYTDNWRKVNAALGSFARYKSSPILVALNQSAVYRSLHRNASAVSDNALFKGVGTTMSLLGVAQHGGAGLAAAARGDAGSALVESSALVSSGLKGSKNPVAYLGGVALSIWTDVAVEASKVDLNQGLPSPFSGDNFTSLYVPAVADAVREVFSVKRLAGWFL